MKALVAMGTLGVGLFTWISVDRAIAVEPSEDPSVRSEVNAESPPEAIADPGSSTREQPTKKRLDSREVTGITKTLLLRMVDEDRTARRFSTDVERPPMVPVGTRVSDEQSAGGGCDSGCDWCWCGTEFENNCPTDWFYDDECDCGCQFCDAWCECSMQDCGAPPLGGACCCPDLSCFNNTDQNDCFGGGCAPRGAGTSCASVGCPCDDDSRPCMWCWTDTAVENNCDPSWEGDGECDCGCQFDDAIDCGACTPVPDYYEIYADSYYDNTVDLWLGFSSYPDNLSVDVGPPTCGTIVEREIIEYLACYYVRAEYRPCETEGILVTICASSSTEEHCVDVNLIPRKDISCGEQQDLGVRTVDVLSGLPAAAEVCVKVIRPECGTVECLVPLFCTLHPIHGICGTSVLVGSDYVFRIRYTAGNCKERVRVKFFIENDPLTTDDDAKLYVPFDQTCCVCGDGACDVGPPCNEDCNNCPSDCQRTCETTVTSYPYCEGFENGFDGWRNVGELDWTRLSGSTPSTSTGPSSAPEGLWYLYTEATGNEKRTATLAGPCFDLSAVSDPQLSFWYHMYGLDMGSLSVELSDDSCSAWTIVWPESGQPKSGNQGNVWQEAQVDLSAYSGSTITIRFVGATGNGYRSDMAIEYICIEDVCQCGDGACDVAPPCNEDCSNCPSDCQPTCGNGTCEPECGETQSSCCADCGCATCEECVEATCQPCYGTGDTEQDGDVDLYDWRALQRCFEASSLDASCKAVDFNCDHGVDKHDHSAFVSVLTGPRPLPCEGNCDVDNDGSITALDANTLWSCRCSPVSGPCSRADLNCDGRVDEDDLAFFQFWCLGP